MNVTLSPEHVERDDDTDVHALTPTARSAASTQADLTSTLRPASRAVPYAWVASNALTYVRPCLPANTEGIAPEDQHDRQGEHRQTTANGVAPARAT